MAWAEKERTPTMSSVFLNKLPVRTLLPVVFAIACQRVCHYLNLFMSISLFEKKVFIAIILPTHPPKISYSWQQLVCIVMIIGRTPLSLLFPLLLLLLPLFLVVLLVAQAEMIAEKQKNKQKKQKTKQKTKKQKYGGQEKRGGKKG